MLSLRRPLRPLLLLLSLISGHALTRSMPRMAKSAAPKLLPSTIKVQRGQIERQLKTNIAAAEALKSEIPALRAQIAQLDYDLVMADLEAKNSQPAPVKAAPASTTSTTSSASGESKGKARKDVKKWFSNLFSK